MFIYISIWQPRMGEMEISSGGGMVGDENEAPRVRRSSLKTQSSSFTNWKHKVLAACFVNIFMFFILETIVCAENIL